MKDVLRRSMFALCSLTTAAIAQTVAVTVNDPRPVNALTVQIEKLSGIPISYEDVRYVNLADIEDVTASVANPAQGPPPAGFQVLIPRGGQLSVPVTVDAASQRLLDSLSTANALTAALAAASASTLIPGKFEMDKYNDVFFVAPQQSRSADGTFVPVTPVLSTPVDLPGQQQSAIQTLESILQQVSQKTGVKVGLGTIPVQAFAVSKVAIAASSQPANYALARLFTAVCMAGSAGSPGTVPGMSYHAFFDPKFKTYALNIHVVPNPNGQQPAQNVQVPPANSGAGAWVNK